MEKKPPKRPKVAWKEIRAPHERKSQPEPYELTEVQPLHCGADSLPFSEKEEAMDVIQKYLRSTEKDELLKMMFLESICNICKVSSKKDSCEGLAVFCHENNLAEKIKVLICFTNTQNKIVQERAMERLWNLSSFIASNSNSCQEPSAKFVRPHHWRDIICMILQTTEESSGDNKKWANTMLDVILRDPATWLTDVPEILVFIQRNLGSNNASAHQILFSVLDVLAMEFPRDVLMSVLIDLPENDSTTLDIWNRLLSLALTSEHFLAELFSILQSQMLCGILNVTKTRLGFLLLAVMHPTEEKLQELYKPELLQVLLKVKSLPILWLVLKGLLLMSERPEMARGIGDLLPNIMETLQFANNANTRIALMAVKIFANVMSHPGKRRFSSIAVNLAWKLLHLFNHVSSEVREGSIRLFKDVMEAVTFCEKRSMKNVVCTGLLPLLFQMSDETPSVAEASRETLIACAKFLGWKTLKRLAQRKRKMEIKECLLQQSRRRVDEYLWQSLSYLDDSQAPLRYEAVEFIGLAMQHSRKQGREKLNAICSALQPLKNDAHPAVRSVATGVIDRCQTNTAVRRQSWLRSLCCCCQPLSRWL
uniref:Uncharacterized LOC107306599 n=1 Tax=Coturnix japonica TaxID=93934 RepID=A0A8C2STA9_COTJA